MKRFLALCLAAGLCLLAGCSTTGTGGSGEVSSSEPSSSESSSSDESSSEVSSSSRPSSSRDDSEDGDHEIDDDLADETLAVTSGGRLVRMNAYDLISEIVESETRGSLNPEAIKAQVVATYTYVKYNNEIGSYPAVNLRSSVSQEVQDAVDAVFGYAMFYDGDFINAVYHSVSCGETASAESVWGTDLPYLQPVESEYDELSPYYEGSYRIDAEDFADAVEDTTYTGTGTEIMDRLRDRAFDPTEFPDTDTYIWFLQNNVIRTTGMECPLPDGSTERRARAMIKHLERIGALILLEE